MITNTSRILLLSYFILFAYSTLSAQDNETFKPSGRIIARGFLDYSAGLNKANNDSGFDITRAFLGYNYQITETLSGQVVIDAAAGRTASGSLETHLRNAFVRYKDKNLEINVGQIGLMQFSTQEDYWTHRYVMKSFQDLYKMAPSVDLGVTAEYQFNSFIAADLSLTNGEGYKNFSKNNSNRYAAGVNLKPIENLLFRVYADIYSDSEDIRGSAPSGSTNITFKDQYTLSLFTGYQNKKISGGLEFNKVFNKDMVEGKDYYGYSVYGSVEVAKKWRVFARYDLMDSNTPTNFSESWNDDGQLMMMGFEFVPMKQIKIAPNVRNINSNTSKSEQYIFINLELNL